MQLRRACALLALLGGLVLLAVGVAAVLGDPAGWHDTASWVGYGLVLLAFAGLGYLLVEKAPLWLGLIVAVCFPLLVASVWQALAQPLDDGSTAEAVLWLAGGVIGLLIGYLLGRRASRPADAVTGHRRS